LRARIASPENNYLRAGTPLQWAFFPDAVL
jgi:hypothetical protein